MANQEQKNTFDVIDELVQILKSSKLIEDRIIEVCRNLKSERDNLKIKLEELENKTGKNFICHSYSIVLDHIINFHAINLTTNVFIHVNFARTIH